MSIDALVSEAKKLPLHERMQLLGIAETAEHIRFEYSHDTLCIELARIIRRNYKPVDCGHVMREDGATLTISEAVEDVLFGMVF